MRRKLFGGIPRSDAVGPPLPSESQCENGRVAVAMSGVFTDLTRDAPEMCGELHGLSLLCARL